MAGWETGEVQVCPNPNTERMEQRKQSRKENRESEVETEKERENTVNLLNAGKSFKWLE